MVIVYSSAHFKTLFISHVNSTFIYSMCFRDVYVCDLVYHLMHVCVYILSVMPYYCSIMLSNIHLFHMSIIEDYYYLNTYVCVLYVCVYMYVVSRMH